MNAIILSFITGALTTLMAIVLAILIVFHRRYVKQVIPGAIIIAKKDFTDQQIDLLKSIVQTSVIAVVMLLLGCGPMLDMDRHATEEITLEDIHIYGDMQFKTVRSAKFNPDDVETSFIRGDTLYVIFKDSLTVTIPPIREARHAK